jgi:hypothetical protein
MTSSGLRRLNTSTWCRLGTFSSPRRVWRAKIESRANAERFSFTAKSGFTSGIAPLRELKLLFDKLYDQDIDSNSSSLARFTIYLGEIYLRVRRGKSRWTRWPFQLSQLTLGLAIRWRNPPAEAGPRTRFSKDIGGYRVLRGQGEGSGLDFWVVGGVGQEEESSGGHPNWPWGAYSHKAIWLCIESSHRPLPVPGYSKKCFPRQGQL